MIERSFRGAGSKGRPALGIAVSLFTMGLLSSGAVAGVVKFPKDNPKITLDVPDDWSVDMTTTGLEIRSPEKNSIIVAQTVVRKKTVVEAWTKEAVAKLQAFGVTFEEKGKSSPKPPATGTAAKPMPPVAPSGSPAQTASVKPGEPAKPSDPAKPSALAKPSDTATPASPAAVTPVTPAKTVDAFTFSGAPSIDTPGTSGPQNKIDPGQFSVEALTGFDGKIKRSPKLHYRTVKYLGSMKDGKPVDAELAIYTLSDERVFLLMQESEPADNRSVAIAESLRGTKDSAK